jgi:hypothetical protein
MRGATSPASLVAAHLSRRPPPGPMLTTEELKALPWAHQTRPFRALGHDFTIRTTDGLLGHYLESIFEGFPEAGSTGLVYSLFSSGEQPQNFHIYGDEVRLTVTSREENVVGTLMWHINRRAISSEPDRVLLHAAAACRDGVGVLLPAPMESGKTTLVAGLLREGFGYLSDEAVALDPGTLLAHPYHKPLTVDEGSWKVLAPLRPTVDPGLEGYLGLQWHVPVLSMRSGALSGPVVPRLVITPRYVSGSTTSLEPMTRAAMLKTLLLSTFHLRASAAACMAVLADVLRGCTCYRLTVGDLGAACAIVQELVDDLVDCDALASPA